MLEHRDILAGAPAPGTGNLFFVHWEGDTWHASWQWSGGTTEVFGDYDDVAAWALAQPAARRLRRGRRISVAWNGEDLRELPT